MAAGQSVTRRKSDPYGNPRGAEPGSWPGSRTFLGTGIDDTNTALTHIGAREYESTTGRFISVDPIIDITDPMQMNGYTYSNGNPITYSDPTGLCSGRDPHGSGCSSAIPGKDYVTPDNPATTPARGDGGGHTTLVPVRAVASAAGSLYAGPNLQLKLHPNSCTGGEEGSKNSLTRQIPSAPSWIT